ncbi:MAG: hypothetical protein N3E50_03235 [Candidatus Goldbacteria bacterium]|nr:hypothetical protein [Candidatus Goldiibacteriota bacterium]
MIQKIKSDKIVYFSFLFFVLFLLSINCKAARPFATDDAPTVAFGEYEIELGYDFNKETGEFGLGFKHGLTNSMDIGIGFGYITISSPNFTPPEISLKYAIIQDTLSFSFVNELGTSNYVINAIFTKKIFEFIEIDVNIGYSLLYPGQIAESHTVTYALAVIAGFEKIDIGIEALGDKEGFKDWQIGSRYSLFDGFNLDAGISGGFKDFQAEEILGTVGLHYEFKMN